MSKSSFWNGFEGRPTRAWSVGMILLVVSATTPLDTLARQVNAGGERRVEAAGTLVLGYGVVLRRHFPDMLYESQGAMDVPFARAAESFGDLDLLPRVDSLRLEYEWAVTGSLPRLSFWLSWVRGEGGILDGKVSAAMPDSIVMQAIGLSADVRVAGHLVGSLFLSLDSLDLAPMSVYSFETRTEGWHDLFADMDSAATRRAFESGFELRNLEIVGVAFESFESDSTAERDVRVVHRVPTRRTIFVPDPAIWIDWTVAASPRRAPPRTVRAPNRPRGPESGRRVAPDRETETRGSTRGSAGNGRGSGGNPFGSKDDDDDKDDESDLLVPAVAAAAAVVGLVFVGGSFGLSGWSDAPTGITAGRMTYRGGFLVHMAVDSGVMTGGADERLRFGITGIGRPALGPFQPMAGAGVRLDDHSGVTTSALSVEVGAALGFERFFVLGGIDVFTGAARAGLVFAFRDPGNRRRDR